ncbi:MAG: tetratricopeptide repeat protein [Bacteroidetes bacterium]|nr:tetratricopeptide repeat protein [Bacteroidota bacterium]
MKPVKKSENRKAPQQQKPSGITKPGPANQLLIWNVVIAVIAFVAFSPCLTGDFLSWDDYNYIRDNALIRIFTWDNILHIFNYKTIVVGNYHPLTMLSYVIEYQLAGLNPFLYHFDNLLLHIFNIALFSRLMWLLTRKTYATLIATALFALHPMRVESVVWAAERKDVLYTFFFLLSLIFYIYFLLKERRNLQYYLLSLLFFLLSVLSKGQAVVLPLVLFLADYWFTKKTTINSVLNKIPYFCISLLSGVMAIIAQHTSLTGQRLMAHTFLERLAIAGFNVSAYLYKLVYPFNLSCFYSYPAPDDMFGVYAGAIIAVAMVVLTALFFRKNRVVVFGSLFFLFTISIVTQILPVGNAIIADRYTYIPYIGFFFIIGYLLDRVITGKQKNARYFLAIPVALVLVYSVKTYAQSMTWHNNVTLWENALRHDPGNGVACTNLGKYYTDIEDYQAGIAMLEKAIQNKAAYADCFQAYQNLGGAYAKVGKNEEAVKSFSAAYALRPAIVDGIFGRGLAYTSLGKYDSAVADFTTILVKLNPSHVQSYYSRGIAYNKFNMADSAIADYTTAIGIDPGYGDAYVNRGNIYFTRNMYDAAIADYNAAIRIIPNDGKIYLNRSFVYFKMLRYKNALDDALKARELKMNVPENYIRDLDRMAKTP